MHVTNLRKVGGSICCDLAAGAKVGLAVDNGCLVVVPTARPRSTLAALLAEAEATNLYPLAPEEREWDDAPAAGRELMW